MKLVFLFDLPAVGKITIARELAGLARPRFAWVAAARLLRVGCLHVTRT